MLRSSLHKSQSLSGGVGAFRRTTCTATALRGSFVPVVRTSKLPILYQRLQVRSYAVAVEDTNKGVVRSSPLEINNEGFVAEPFVPGSQ